MVLLFAARRLPKESFRASNAAYFLLLSALILSALAARGVIEGRDLVLAAGLLPAALLGKKLGTRLVPRVSDSGFRAITLGVVLLTGLLGAATALFALA